MTLRLRNSQVPLATHSVPSAQNFSHLENWQAMYSPVQKATRIFSNNALLQDTLILNHVKPTDDIQILSEFTAPT